MSDADFVNKFLTLASLQKPKFPSNYQKRLDQIDQLGVALPQLRYKYNFNKRKSSTTDDKLVSKKTITLKSIKAPKFNIKDEFDSNLTIFQLKQVVLNKVPEIKQIGQLKILLKGKVLHDTSNLQAILSETENATFTVMISAPKVEETPTDIDQMDMDITDVEQPKEVIPWNEILQVLQKKNSLEKSNELLERLKKGWELAK